MAVVEVPVSLDLVGSVGDIKTLMQRTIDDCHGDAQILAKGFRDISDNISSLNHLGTLSDQEATELQGFIKTLSSFLPKPNDEVLL